MKKYRAGVLFGEELHALYQDAKDNQFALPAVNTIGTNTINATLETAAKVNSPVIIQFSNGGAQFIAGKGMPNDNLQGNISGAISGALHIHNVAKYYGVPVVLHTDHAAKKWLPWISGLIDAGETAAAWLAGCLIWAWGAPILDLSGWWLAFLILTIAGERLELSRFLPRRRGSMPLYLLATILVVGGAALGLTDPWGARLMGLGLAGLTLWLARHEPAKAELVKLRYFAGLSLEEAAACLGISVATAKRHWAVARAWLFAALSDDETGGTPPA